MPVRLATPRPLALAVLLLSAVSAGAPQEVGPTPPPVHGQTSGMSEPRIPPNQAPPPVRVDPNPLMLGDVPTNTKVSAEFTLTNTSDTPLVIGAAMSNCWCTVATPTEKILEPGKPVRVPVTLDTGPTVINVERHAIIRFDGYAKQLTCRILANVNNGVRMSFQPDVEGHLRTGVITLEASDGVAFRILSTSAGPPEYVDGFDPQHNEARTKYEFRFDMASIAIADLPPYYVIALDHPNVPILEIAMPDWEPSRRPHPWAFSEGRASMGVIPAGEWHDFVVTMQSVKDGGLDAIESVHLDPDIGDVQIFGMDQQPESLKVRLRFTPCEGTRGLVVAQLTIVAKGHDESITLMGRVE